MDQTPVARILTTEFGVVPLSTELIQGGLDALAANWHVHAENGRQYVLKSTTSTTATFELALHLFNAGIEDVLAPLPTLTGAAKATDGDCSYQLFPFFAGENGFQRELRSEHWRRLGTTLRRIHDLPTGLEIPRETFHVEGLPEFEELKRRAPESPVTEALHTALAAHTDDVYEVLSRVRELGELCRAETWHNVYCHADLHVGNVLVSHDDVKVIDWDTARLAPRECDLVFFLGGGITGHGPEPEFAFCEGYGACEPNILLVTYYRYARAAEDIIAFSRDASDPGYGSEGERMEAIRYLEGLFKPRMIVQTARDSFNAL